MHKFYTRMVPGALASLLMVSPSFATGPEDLISDDLITSSNLTTPWQVCDTDSQAIDVTLLNAGACAFRTTPALPNVTYSMSCCLLYTSPSPRDATLSRMPSSA